MPKLVLFAVLDHRTDFCRLRLDRCSNTVAVPISADGWTSVPDNWPSERILSLNTLIDADTLRAEVEKRRTPIINQLFAHPDCPYYKVKQIVDTIIEKQVIVERLAVLSGNKIYVKQRGSWFAVDGDNSENLRIASLLMDGLPGFVSVTSDRMWSMRYRCRLMSRWGRDMLRASRVQVPIAPNSVLIGEMSYGSAGDFTGRSSYKINRGTVILSLLWSFRLRDFFYVLTHDQPIKLRRTKAERRHPMVPILRTLLRRASRLNHIVRHLAYHWKGFPYYFTVNYGPMIDLAIARAVRYAGVPIVTMQHACVGHDEWTASQYLDTWLSDIKVVTTAVVADELSDFETLPRHRYLVATLPIFRSRTVPKPWDGRVLIYTLTGFTRANTMYDNRRINDVLYLDAIDKDLAILCRHFDVILKPHPYDERQYNHSIARWLSRRHSCRIEYQITEDMSGAVLIDSPSTILADTIRSGRIVFLINRTGKLRQRFCALATSCGILFETAEELTRHLNTFSLDALCKKQEYYREIFLRDYCGDVPSYGIFDVIDSWMRSLQYDSRIMSFVTKS